MLRYFYLILLLVCIKWCFCDDYISNQDLDYRNVHNKLTRGSIGRHYKTRSDHRRHRDIPSYEEEEEEAPVAQIDVASFISSDNQEENNNDAGVDDSLYELQKESNSNNDKTFENNYGAQSALNYNYDVNNIIQNANYLSSDALVHRNMESEKYEPRKHNLRFNREMNIGDLQNVPVKRSRKDDSSDLIESQHPNIGIPHQPKKKCTLKNMRIPFFSHDKSTKANKKGKKRKFFGGCNKKDNKVDVNNSNKKKDNYELSSKANYMARNSNVRKRSPYREYRCPLCKTVFRSSAPYVSRVRRLSNNLIHNSRQFYANSHINRNPKAVKLEARHPEDKDSLQSLENLELRLARQSPSDEDVSFNSSTPFDKGQQLRELEEVERRINEIGERTKIFEKHKQQPHF